MVTPVIEDFQRLAGKTPFAWREFWRHCIGTAIMTREVINAVQVPPDEADYVAGLIHDVGKIIMASTFSEHFAEVQRLVGPSGRELVEVEEFVLGINHCDLGALYLQHHRLPDIMIETAKFHHAPASAQHHGPIVAAVQIADLLVRHAKIGVSGNPSQVLDESWLDAPGWSILFKNQDDEHKRIARASMQRSLERLPTILEGLV